MGNDGRHLRIGPNLTSRGDSRKSVIYVLDDAPGNAGFDQAREPVVLDELKYPLS